MESRGGEAVKGRRYFNWKDLSKEGPIRDWAQFNGENKGRGETMDII